MAGSLAFDFPYLGLRSPEAFVLSASLICKVKVTSVFVDVLQSTVLVQGIVESSVLHSLALDKVFLSALMGFLVMPRQHHVLSPAHALTNGSSQS